MIECTLEAYSGLWGEIKDPELFGGDINGSQRCVAQCTGCMCQCSGTCRGGRKGLLLEWEEHQFDTTSVVLNSKLYGNIDVECSAMARCACVACNSCTCACSCRGAVPEFEGLDW